LVAAFAGTFGVVCFVMDILWGFAVALFRTLVTLGAVLFSGPLMFGMAASRAERLSDILGSIFEARVYSIWSFQATLRDFMKRFESSAE
jgi:hypothetical protein